MTGTGHVLAVCVCVVFGTAVADDYRCEIESFPTRVLEGEEADKLRKLVTHIQHLEAWERGFKMMQSGEAVKILVDMGAD